MPEDTYRFPIPTPEKQLKTFGVSITTKVRPAPPDRHGTDQAASVRLPTDRSDENTGKLPAIHTYRLFEQYSSFFDFIPAYFSRNTAQCLVTSGGT